MLGALPPDDTRTGVKIVEERLKHKQQRRNPVQPERMRDDLAPRPHEVRQPSRLSRLWRMIWRW